MNRIRQWARVSALAGVVFVGTNMIACDTTSDPPATQNAPNIDDVIFQGLASDEALLALLNATEQTDATQSVVVDSPLEGATLPKDVPPTMTWHVKGTTAARPLHPTNWFVRAASLTSEWIGPQNAWAHGAPVNGRAYYLVFSAQGQPDIVRVFTTELSYTFDAATWLKLTQVGAPITLRITNAIFESNRIAMDGGPFSGEPVSFTTGP